MPDKRRKGDGRRMASLDNTAAAYPYRHDRDLRGTQVLFCKRDFLATVRRLLREDQNRILFNGSKRARELYMAALRRLQEDAKAQPSAQPSASGSGHAEQPDDPPTARGVKAEPGDSRKASGSGEAASQEGTPAPAGVLPENAVGAVPPGASGAAAEDGSAPEVKDEASRMSL
eukprot:tig00020830_g14435.t1